MVAINFQRPSKPGPSASVRESLQRRLILHLGVNRRCRDCNDYLTAPPALKSRAKLSRRSATKRCCCIYFSNTINPRLNSGAADAADEFWSVLQEVGGINL